MADGQEQYDMTATYSKPTTIPKWADTSLNVTEPSSGKKDEGWLVGEKGISSWENWKAKLVGDWFKWLNERFSDGASKDALRVLCPKTGTQTLEIDENIVRFFEVATPSEQASIRKSTSKDELQLVFSESASYYYPCLAYNLAAKRLALHLNRSGIGDDVDMGGVWSVDRDGNMYLTNSEIPAFWFRDTGATGAASSWKFEQENNGFKLTACDQNYANPVIWMWFNSTLTYGINFYRTIFARASSGYKTLVCTPESSGAKAPIQIEHQHLSPTSLDSGDLWHHNPTAWQASTAYVIGQYVINGTLTARHVYVCTDAGTSAGSGGPTGRGTGITDGGCEWDCVNIEPDAIRAYLDSREVTIAHHDSPQTAKAWCKIQTDGIGGVSFVGYAYNVSSVELNETFLIVHLIDPLRDTISGCPFVTSCDDTNQTFLAYVTDGGETITIKSHVADTGNAVFFDDEAQNLQLVVFGQLN